MRDVNVSVSFNGLPLRPHEAVTQFQANLLPRLLVLPQQEISDQDSSSTQENSVVGVNVSANNVSEEEEEEPVDYVRTPEWRKQRKHIFILSEAGKPIYSRSSPTCCVLPTESQRF